MPVKPPDKGLLLSSRVDFTIPSPFAQEHLYYLIQYRPTMDCRLPHRYYVTEPTELLWFHFSGGESAASTVQATFPAYSAAVKK